MNVLVLTCQLAPLPEVTIVVVLPDPAIATVLPNAVSINAVRAYQHHKQQPTRESGVHRSWQAYYCSDGTAQPKISVMAANSLGS